MTGKHKNFLYFWHHFQKSSIFTSVSDLLNNRIWSTKIFFTYITWKYTLSCPRKWKKIQIDFWTIWLFFSRWVTHNLFYGKWGIEYGFETFFSKTSYRLNESQKPVLVAHFSSYQWFYWTDCFQKKIGFTRVWTLTNCVHFMKILVVQPARKRECCSKTGMDLMWSLSHWMMLCTGSKNSWIG